MRGRTDWRPRAAFAAVLVAGLALPAAAGKEKAVPRLSRPFDHDGHAAALRQKSGGTEGCAGKCHRVQIEGEWIHEKKKEHTRCFEGCHTFATSCGTLAAGTGVVCATCHTNLKQRCLPAGFIRPIVTPGRMSSMPARYSHRAHIKPDTRSGKQCQSCHGELGESSPQSQAGSIGHDDCGPCHGKVASPRMTQCASCHKAGAPTGSGPRPPDPFSMAGAFSHKRHASQPRVGAAGRDCLACHANIAQATDDSVIPLPTMRGCLDGCHDGARAFSAVGATCTRCHTGSAPARPASTSARFSHAEHGKRGVDLVRCSACHALGRDFQVSPPTTGRDHQPCATSGCHADDFMSQGRPVCGVCHESTEPWTRQAARYRQRSDSEFGSDFSHQSHAAARGGKAHGVIRRDLVSPSGGDRSGREDNATCRACHGDVFAGGDATRGHEACAPCHGKGTAPEMDRCGGCHRLGAEGGSVPRKASPWSVAARFQHRSHADDPRSRQEARCVECHATVGAARRLGQIVPPTMKSCDGCHDGTHAFKTTGFGCVKCHAQRDDAPAR